MSLPELLSKEVSVKRALMALGTGFLLIAVLGSGIGYTWFWNQFDDQPYLQQQVIKYTNILEEQPGNYVVLTELGWALYQLGELDKAIACFQKVLEINPDYISARYNLSLAYKGKKNYELARRELKTIVDKYPRHELAWLSLGEVLMELKKYGDAVEALDRTISISPANATAHYLKGVALERLGRKIDAIRSFENALKYDPKYEEAIEAKERLK